MHGNYVLVFTCRRGGEYIERKNIFCAPQKTVCNSFHLRFYPNSWSSLHCFLRLLVFTIVILQLQNSYSAVIEEL